jgi:hypothetical protein
VAEPGKSYGLIGTWLMSALHNFEFAPALSAADVDLSETNEEDCIGNTYSRCAVGVYGRKASFNAREL